LLNEKVKEDEYGQLHGSDAYRFWSKNLKRRGNFKNLGCREVDNIKMALKEIE
jgi:hypothetical protein